MQRISRFRMIMFIIIILAMIGVFALRLYKTQVVAFWKESLRSRTDLASGALGFSTR